MFLHSYTAEIEELSKIFIGNPVAFRCHKDASKLGKELLMRGLIVAEYTPMGSSYVPTKELFRTDSIELAHVIKTFLLQSNSGLVADAVYKSPGINQSDLANMLKLKNTTVGQVTGKLESLKLVEKHLHGETMLVYPTIQMKLLYEIK